MIDARDYFLTAHWGADGVNWPGCRVDRFAADSASDLRQLGHAFAYALWPEDGAVPAVLRIGLSGVCGSGKSTFSRAILTESGARYQIEKPAMNAGKLQAVWRRALGGHVRMLDAAMSGATSLSLPSYLKNDISRYALPFIDLVEHPLDDKNDRNFDCLISILGEDSAPRRQVEALSTEEFAKTSGFSRFLSSVMKLAA